MKFTVWCWGWDGAGDLDGPDVDPIWERRPNRTTIADVVKAQPKPAANEWGGFKVVNKKKKGTRA